MGSSSDNDSTESHQSSPRDLSIRVKRRPMPRKGHRKSRNGCLTCKKRKVKCDEVSPRCDICARLSLTCVFASDKSTSPESSYNDLGLARSMSTDPSWFNIADTRFLQHFLFAAYPTLPLDGWTVWQGVSQMSYEYDFLIHAMLALGASHLNMLLGGTYVEAAIQHRVTAIKGLNKFLSSAHLNLHNADAAFAATLILAFQSHQMGEGLIEFLTMVRGCHLVGVHAIADFDNSLFRTFEREYYVKSASNLMKPTNAFARFGPEMVRGFCGSVKKLAPLYTSVQDLEYLALLQRVAMATVDNPLLGYLEHTRLYDRFGWFTSEEFSRFIDPHNYPAWLLILHMLILDNVMDSSIRETGTAATGSSIRHTFVYKPRILLAWTEAIANSLPAEYVPYSEWPVQFARSINRNQQQLLDWPETASTSTQSNATEMMI